MSGACDVTPKLRTIAPRIRTIETRAVLPPPKTAAPIYKSPEWRALIASIIAERGRRCQDCGRTDCRIYGDHVVELRDGGAPFDRRNVRLRCATCHGRKTIAERVKRLRS